MNTKQFPNPLPVTFSELVTIVDEQHTTQIMAMYDGKPAGCISLRHTKFEKPHAQGGTDSFFYTVAYFYHLFVHECVRGHGVGRALVERCCLTAKLHGSTSICLNVSAKNHIILPFYQKLGFVPGYEYPHPDATLILTKQLVPWTPVTPAPKEVAV